MTKNEKKPEPSAGRRFSLMDSLEHLGVPVRVQRSLLLVLLVGILAFIIVPKGVMTRTDYTPGEVASRDIKASRDLLIPDEKLTAEKRLEAEKAVHFLYDFDASAGLTIADQLFRVFRQLREDQALGNSPEQIRLRFEANLAAAIDEKQFQAALDIAENPAVLDELRQILVREYRQKVVANRKLFESDRMLGVVFRNLMTQQETVDAGTEAVTDLDTLLGDIAADMGKASLDDAQKKVLLLQLSSLLRPNISFNQKGYEQRKLLARDNVQPVLFQVKKGEMIVREGDRITPAHIVKISAMEEVGDAWSLWRNAAGLLLSSFLLIFICHRFAWRNIRKYRAETRDLVFMMTTLIILVLILKVGIFISSALGSAFPYIDHTAYYYMLPFAVGTMLVRIVLNSEVALVFTAISAILAGLLFGSSFIIFVFAFLSSLGAAHWVRQVTERSSLFKAGFRLSLFNFLLIFGLHLLTTKPFDLQLLYKLGFGLAGGVAAAVIVTGLIPLVESAFCYTTNIKLLELANMNNPVLRDLMIQAPGTYHHSIVVGNLAESAAEAIGANPLLARVAAYYHDIGKIRKPLYFVENITTQENRHDKLAPSMSALILLAHIKDGVDLAREYRLGKDLVDILQQHHGTSLMKYFYEKAKNSEDPDVQQANESDYRYLGPKPQSREAALIMLADAVEAAGRTLIDPTPARIQGMVQKIINNIFIDGQLDECEVTLKDLHNIAKSFNLILSGTFHHRVDYPEPVSKERSTVKTPDKSNEDNDRKQTKENKGQKAAAKKGGSEDLKRLGMS
jgi:putative nucleotidyltransferase with HDIG domain